MASRVRVDTSLDMSVNFAWERRKLEIGVLGCSHSLSVGGLQARTAGRETRYRDL